MAAASEFLESFQRVVTFAYLSIHYVWREGRCAEDVHWLNCKHLIPGEHNTAWKVSKYGVFSGPNLGRYGQEKAPCLDTFHAVLTFVNTGFYVI